MNNIIQSLQDRIQRFEGLLKGRKDVSTTIRRSQRERLFFPFFVFFVSLWCVSFFLPLTAGAQESTCAEAKIEIAQELTLERQAFEAHMRIHNGLEHITLENVAVTVNFTDEDGNPVEASLDPDSSTATFFIRVDEMQHISDVDGAGTVAPSTSADIYWLIIPAPGASDGNPQGKLYYVGATLTYTIGGEEHVTEVTPDYIYVKPMPELFLDYFLPHEVYGDDAWTTETEAPVPFSLGVRVSNLGFGTAWNLKIDSAQPKIVDNEQGLLVDFLITGSEVNGQPAMESLLVDVGNIAPDTAGVARWIMTCSLSGQFVEFTADFSHADELGGQLTSLIEEVNTHFLVHDVLVDLPGRDGIRDFLATDCASGDACGPYTVYESENTETEVTDQSDFSNLTGSGTTYTLTVPVTPGFLYVHLPISETLGEGGQVSALRSDGKQITPENVWISKTRKPDPQDGWEYFVNVFDAKTTDTYTIVFEGAEAQPPVLEFIPDQTGMEAQPITFLVEASDPDGTIPTLSAAPLAVGASFTDHGDGTGTFDWTPVSGQAGTYAITVEASDGELTDSLPVTITVTPDAGYMITASAGTGGSITPSGDVTVEHGADQRFTITPDPGYNIADVLVDGSSIGAVSAYTFTNVTDDHTIAAMFSATPTPTPTPEPQPLTISGHVLRSDGFSGLPDVVLNELPGSPTTDELGYYQADVASGWSGKVTPQKLDYSFTPVFRSYSSLMVNMEQQDYTATAPSQTLTIVLAGDGSGMVTGDGGITCGTVCMVTVEKYTQVYLSAIPDAGSVFAGADGAECTLEGTCVLTMTEDTTVTVTFGVELEPTPTPTVGPEPTPTPTTPVIPEPATGFLMLLGLLALLGLGLGGLRKKE